MRSLLAGAFLLALVAAPGWALARCGDEPGDAAAVAAARAEVEATCKRCAARSTCGKPGFVTCCRTSAGGVTRCSTKRDAERCVAPAGGSACVGSVSSCCDACTDGGCAPPPTP
jgi:hypothetical protein